MPKINRNEKHEETMKERYYRIVNSSEPAHVEILNAVENQEIFNKEFNANFSVAFNNEGANIVDNEEYLHRERVFEWKLKKEGVLDPDNDNKYYEFIKDKLENNPDRMGLALLSFTNIDHISKDSDVFKKLSKLALDNLEILPEEDTNHTINLQVLRGLGRKGLLDWNNFLSREDSLNIEDQLTVEYEESLHRSVEHSGQRLGMEKSPFLMSMNDERKKYVEESESLYLDNVSENNLNKYFGSSDLNFNFAKIDGIKIRSSLGTKTVEDSLDRFSSKSRMNESDACHMPRRDFRFNFHMDQNYNNRKNKINLLARIFAKAQIEGLPISSKTTMRDLKYYEKGYINRHMIYADVETAKQIIGYIKEISPEILKEDGGQVEYRESEFCGYLDIFKEDGIFIRTTHEVDCDEGSKEIILSNLNQIIPSE